MIENEDLATTLRGLTIESCIKVFGSYDVKLQESQETWDKAEGRMLCGVLGFMGTGVRGTCLLVATEGPLERSCPSGGRLRDWVGELTNQLGGKLKSQFLVRNVEICLATPVVLSGIQVTPLAMKEGDTPVVLEEKTRGLDGGGKVMVWVEAESTGTFTLGPPAPVVCRDGQVVLF